MKKLTALLLCVLMLQIILPAAGLADGSAWTCSACGQTGNTGNYCTNCAAPRPQNGTWTCPACGQTGNTGNYCSNCAHPKNGSAGSYSVNMTVTFGSYPQSSPYRSDPIEWRILDIDGHSGLLMATHGLDCVQFHHSLTSVTWATSSVRVWLNSTFLNKAFNANERSAIQETYVINEKNPIYPNTPWGANTYDYVFLLSVQEAERYLPRNGDRLFPMTDYAVSRGAYQNNSGYPYSWWWMRSPGGNAQSAARVRGGDGTDYPAGAMTSNKVTDDEDVVIPCIWVDLNKLPAPSGSTGQSSRPSQPAQPAEIYALATQRLAVNSGPGTKRYFDELGTYNVAGQYVLIYAKAWDPNNGIWWLECLVPGTGVVGWTGLKRFDTSTFDLDAVPTEIWY